MPCVTRLLVRSTLLLALAGGAAVAVAGPERVSAIFSQTRSKINSSIDKHIEDPVALRAQLRDLEGQYPARIAEIRADLIELESQMSQLNRELAVSERVVALADADLAEVQGLLAKAEEARVQNVGHVIRVRVDNQSMDLDTAYSKANTISQSRSAYAARAADIERDLGYLDQQRERLSTILGQLETERAEFQTQLFTLDRQVDAIARNERMIELMSKRQETLDKASRYEAASLDQLTSKMADIRARQESELQTLASRGTPTTYEQQAKYQLDIESARPGLVRPSTVEVRPPVLEITPEKADTVTIDPDRIARND
jgi:predicted RNase H-like nuclease (RuvC/YqgF family)